MDTVPFVIDVPILEDEAVFALRSFLEDLLRQFENHYFAQLHRYDQAIEALRREAPELWKYRTAAASDTDRDVDFDDEIPF